MTDSRFEELCDRFEASWREGHRLSIESLLTEPAADDRGELLQALLEIELEYRFQRGHEPALEEYQARFPDRRDNVVEAFAAAQRRLQSASRDELPETHCASGDQATKFAGDDLRRVGPYQILQPIGRGGMGQVFMAEQTEPVKRRVALKVIKTETPTKEILARFEAERQALAMMDHHHIAKVFDAGVTKNGRPYFVMELVKGVPITEYCDKNKLSPDERLGLFVQTCRAIQHAHTKGIVHRDIKPANVLVTLDDGRPTVKVIDFGLAKALHDTTRLTDRTLFTQYGQVVGTLAYMSPEQAALNSLDVDTRTDVYSLGVVFYELLTGSTPITAEEIRREAFDRILALIRELEPPRPSARLSDSGDKITGISDQRRTEPRRLSLMLKGDLDWIAIKALEKDRTRRYDTPAALADDVQRFLDSEAIEARPPSLGYQLQKSLRKHRARYIAASTLLGLLIAGLAGTGTMWYRASTAEKRASQEADNTKAALIEAELQRDRANANKKLADRKAAEAELEAAEKERQAKLASDTAAAAKFQLANARWDAGQAEQARQILHEIPNEYRNNFEWHYCNRQFLGSDLTLYGHLGEVFSVDYSPDGKYLVSGGQDSRFKLWDTETGQDIADLEGHGAAVFGVRFSPDGKYIASWGADKLIRLWDAATRKELQTLHGHSEHVANVCFGHDGKQLASASSDGTIRRWNTSSGQLVDTIRLKQDKRSPSGFHRFNIVFTPDGKSIASVGLNGGNITIWNAQTGEESQSIQRAETPWDYRYDYGKLMGAKSITSLRFSPSGRHLAAGYRDGSIQLWNVSTWKELGILEGYSGDGHIRFSPDGSRVAAVGRTSNTIKIWDVFTGREIAELKGHAIRLSIHDLCFRPDSSAIVSCGSDRTIKVWDLTDSKNIATSRAHQGNVMSVCFSPDGRQIATSSNDDVIKVWNANTLEELQTFYERSVPGTRVWFSPDWKLFVTANLSGGFTLWNLQSGDLVKELKGRSDDRLTTLCFSADGSRIATGSYGGAVTSWNTHTGDLAWTESRHSAPIRSVCFDKQGTKIASAATHNVDRKTYGIVKLWEANTGEELKELRMGPSNCLSFSPDGKTLASAGSGAAIWNVGTGEFVNALQGHSDYVASLSFNEDGTRIVTGGGDGTVRLWHASTGEEIKTLTADETSYLSVQFSPDGKRIVTGSSDGAIGIWNATPTNEFDRLEAHTGATICVCFASDGSLFASGGADTTIKIWDTKSRSVVKTLKGHSELVSRVRFSTDGNQLYSKSENERFVWNVASGEILTDAEWSDGTVATRHGNIRARVSGEQIILVDLDWKRTDIEKARRSSNARPKRWWHREQMQIAIDEEHWYAALFHAAWLSTLSPNSPSAYYDTHNALRQLDPKETLNLPAVVNEALRLPRPQSTERSSKSKAIAKALAGHPLPPTEIVLADLHRLLPTPVFIDKRGIEEIGVSTKTLLQLSGGHSSLQAQLDDALKDFELSWCTTQTVLVLTSENALRKRFEDTRLYRLLTPRGDFRSVMSGVQEVFPKSWEALGGRGTIEPVGSFYAIRQSPAVHRELANTLQSQSLPHQFRHPLDSIYVSLSMRGARITEILASISEQIGLAIKGSPGLAAVGLDLSNRRHAMDIDLQNVSAKDALDLVLQQVECAWVMDGKKLVVKDEDSALEELSSQHFSVPSGPGMDARDVMNVIQISISPGSWTVLGGDGEITASRDRPGQYVIRQGQPAMREVEQFIRELQAIR